jgi:hypothetical protein
MAEAPNFIKAESGYEKALQSFLGPRKFLKMPLTPEGSLPVLQVAGSLVIHAAGSPRGDYKHCVVAVVAADGKSLELAWDPHQEATGLLPHPQAWAGIIMGVDAVE